jgi:histidine triad (HIT) family protein
MDCIFCKIANREIDTEVIFENAEILAFEDQNPQAPTHILVIPKKHISNIQEMAIEDQQQLLPEIFQAIQQIADEKDLGKGYRVVNNCNHNGGQTVPHLHFHLLGGRVMQWPPG